jgi:hypothetical protein
MHASSGPGVPPKDASMNPPPTPTRTDVTLRDEFER